MINNVNYIKDKFLFCECNEHNKNYRMINNVNYIKDKFFYAYIINAL